jgi:hypothetical protein
MTDLCFSAISINNFLPVFSAYRLIGQHPTDFMSERQFPPFLPSRVNRFYHEGRHKIRRTVGVTAHLHFWEANEREGPQNIDVLLAIESILAEDEL